MTVNEATVENAALAWLGELKYSVVHGPDIAPGGEAQERSSFGTVLLEERLRQAIARLNPKIPAEAQEEALRKILLVATPSFVQTNRTFHKMLRDGVAVEYRRPDGSIAGDNVKLVDFSDPDSNDWLAVNQFTVIENHHERRPDIVVFVNGLPLSLIELKNAADEEATIWSAYQQIQTYKAEIPSLLFYNAALIVSDGLEARMGSLTAKQEWFKVWRTVEGLEDAPEASLELETLIRGVFDQRRFLSLLEHFIVFEEDTESDRLNKIIAGYHQFHAVNVAVDETVRASGMTQADDELSEPGTYFAGGRQEGEAGDRKAGVVWHTQGSGKSFSMLFYAGRIIRHPVMQNPTIVVLTDRNDLDDQLFGQFKRCHDILGQTPLQADSREELREQLTRSSGGVIFTTIHKFLSETGEKMPSLSDRRNIVVVADEAHRSQYGFKVRVNKKTGKKSIGLAASMRQALPGATFIGFTGTPIEKTDANTRAVFGDYISVYDIQRAVHDGATVPIYYESRISKLRLNREAMPTLDDEFDEITEGQELTDKEKVKTRWAALETLVGDPQRIELIAHDLVEHFERRSEAMKGKAMIVCMSRRICVDMYKALIKLRPDWASDQNDNPEVEQQKDCVAKVVMTGGAADGPDWQPHVRNKDKRRKLAKRFQDSKDSFRIVIVRDMWLTGFDAPSMHTMYIDKPMQGHGLMQAIARVNRVFRDKPGGLIVDYLGLADQLKRALATYTESGGTGSPTFDADKAVEVMREKYSIVCDMMHGFNWSKWTTGTPAERLALLPAGQEHVLQLEDGKARYTKAVLELSHAFALCAASEEAAAIRDDVAFFQAISAALNKKTAQNQKSPEEIDAAVRQLVSKAIAPEGEVIDVFSAAGLKKPDIGILDERFLAEVRNFEHKNVAAELLEKLLKDEIKLRAKRNLVQSEDFSEKLQKTLNGYHNRAIATQEVIERMISLAQEMDAARKRGEEMGLTDDEVAFYDALANNKSARDVIGDDKLKVIAAELIAKVRNSTTIDWHLREGAKAKIRVLVKRILNKHGFPPDLQAEAIQKVLGQAELLCKDWV